MSYITHDHVVTAIQNMRAFYTQLIAVYQTHGMNLTDNLGRRNILMSEPMEHFLAKSLRTSFAKVDNDGRTGKSDIIVHLQHGEQELECKLTSPHTSGAIAFQSDYETLEKKGELDYIYMVANKGFDGFVVIHFEGLSIEDYHNLSTGSRGKVQMIKRFGMKKANVIIGKVISSVDTQVEDNNKVITTWIRSTRTKITKWEKEISEGVTKYRAETLNAQTKRAMIKLLDKIQSLCEKEKIIKTRKPRYTFEFETIK